jgi:hypothetical protein
VPLNSPVYLFIRFFPASTAGVGFVTTLLTLIATLRQGNRMKILGFTRVAEWRICIGCGACTGISKNGGVSLVNIVSSDIRLNYQPVYTNSDDMTIAIYPGMH